MLASSLVTLVSSLVMLVSSLVMMVSSLEKLVNNSHLASLDYKTLVNQVNQARIQDCSHLVIGHLEIQLARTLARTLERTLEKILERNQVAKDWRQMRRESFRDQHMVLRQELVAQGSHLHHIHSLEGARHLLAPLAHHAP